MGIKNPLNMRSNIKNRSLFCHDNLEILKRINNSCIDLIYLDPPFNKKKIFTASLGSDAEGANFDDIFGEENIGEGCLDTLRENQPKLYSFLNGIQGMEGKQGPNFCYLIFMAIRILEMHRILKDTGSIYLHCDHTMSHYLKILMDIIFGEKNFRNDIAWCYEGPSSSRMSSWARKHDNILLYNKKRGLNTWFWEAVAEEYAASSISSFKSPSKFAAGKDRSQYIQRGKYPKDWWPIPSLKNTKERLGYPTQKPIKLLERIIKASSKEGDMVLDPFCGSATTCIAAEKLNRKWIGIDVSEMSYVLIKKRLTEELRKKETENHDELFWKNKINYETNLPRSENTNKV
ncbi:MAG: site-specific DNA-methyltransferase [Cytophagales bacterium]|nr:site-specific DNA-methyltransferase [Cytophagales bacterium]